MSRRKRSVFGESEGGRTNKPKKIKNKKNNRTNKVHIGTTTHHKRLMKRAPIISFRLCSLQHTCNLPCPARRIDGIHIWISEKRKKKWSVHWICWPGRVLYSAIYSIIHDKSVRFQIDSVYRFANISQRNFLWNCGNNELILPVIPHVTLKYDPRLSPILTSPEQAVTHFSATVPSVWVCHRGHRNGSQLFHRPPLALVAAVWWIAFLYLKWTEK